MRPRILALVIAIGLMPLSAAAEEVTVRNGGDLFVSGDTVLSEIDSPGDAFVAAQAAKVGGTSLAGGTPPAGLVILQSCVGDRSLKTPDMLTSLAPLLFRPGKTADGIVIVASPQDGPGTQLTLMAMASLQKRAERLMETALIRLGI